MAMQEKTLF
jgi:hypothetical protein